MTDKEIAEIRRRLTPDKSSITEVIGCYVNEKREIISEFRQSLGIIPEEEAKSFLNLFKKTLSGTQGQNLIDIAFPVEQVMSGEEHKLLMELRSSGLKDNELVQSFFDKVVSEVSVEGSYLLLIAHDIYDVPFRAGDGKTNEDGSTESYSHILCSLCPVKQLKPALSYTLEENEFHVRAMDWVVSAPILGFTFPAFDGRRTNIHNALYYTRSTSENHQEFSDAVFNIGLPLPADVQKETFREVLSEALQEECSLEVLQAVHDGLSERIEEYKQTESEEPLTVSHKEVRRILEDCGVSEEHADAFEERFNEEFGTDSQLTPHNMINKKQFEVKTPDVTIKVNPERSELIETRIINGRKYILIAAGEGVEVNGVSISIKDE